MSNWRMGDTAADYPVANSEAARWARGKFEREIEHGRVAAAQTIDRIVNTVPQDAIVSGRGMEFLPTETGVELKFGDRYHGLHDNGFKQACSKAKLPIKYGRYLEAGDDWQRRLLARVLTETFQQTDRRHFVRAVDGDVRAVLSDHYAPYDSVAIVEAVVGQFQKLGIVPLSGTASDTRWSLKGVLPYVFEPFADEIVTYGLDIQNSDFGNGAFAVRFFCNRVMCTNKMTTEDGLKKVHLGGRLDDTFTFSRKTYELNSQALISATEDTVQGLLGPGKVTAFNEFIRDANEKDLSWSQARKKIGTSLSKAELEQVEDSFNGADVMNLPPNKSQWRLSNAVSWLAVNTDNADRKLELERVAAEVVGQ